MVITRLFKSNTTQAVRLPKDVAFPDEVTDVEITVVGESRVIAPAGRRWDVFFTNGTAVSDDFMSEGREQPPAQERTTWWH